MIPYPATMRVSPALAADLVAAVVAFGSAFAVQDSLRAWTLASGAGLLFVALVRFGARPPIGFVLDEAGKQLQIGARWVPVSDIAVGPREADGRSFRLYVLDARVRTYAVSAEVVPGAAALHTALERLGTRVTVAHAERRDFAVTVRRVIPVALGLFGITFMGRAMAIWGSDPLPPALFGGIGFVFAVIDAVGVAGPPLLVDATRGRIFWKHWHRISDVTFARPRISNLSEPDLVLIVAGVRVRLGMAWTAVTPLKAELTRLGVVKGDA